MKKLEQDYLQKTHNLHFNYNVGIKQSIIDNKIFLNSINKMFRSYLKYIFKYKFIDILFFIVYNEKL